MMNDEPLEPKDTVAESPPEAKAPDTPRLTHVDADGRLRMVDISGKPRTRRSAVAQGTVVMRRETLDAIANGQLPKGDVLACAKLAGIGAAKRTDELIPLCHRIALHWVDVVFAAAEDQLYIEATAVAEDCTGVEMEALAAVSVAALTVYDMCKAIDREMRIEDIRLREKRGGKQDLSTTAQELPSAAARGR